MSTRHNRSTQISARLRLREEFPPFCSSGFVSGISETNHTFCEIREFKHFTRLTHHCAFCPNFPVSEESPPSQRRLIEWCKFLFCFPAVLDEQRRCRQFTKHENQTSRPPLACFLQAKQTPVCIFWVDAKSIDNSLRSAHVNGRCVIVCHSAFLSCRGTYPV